MAEENFGLLREIEEGLNHMLGGFKGTIWLKPYLDRYGGQKIYIPKTTERYKQLRDQQIKLTLLFPRQFGIIASLLTKTTK